LISSSDIDEDVLGVESDLGVVRVDLRDNRALVKNE